MHATDADRFGIVGEPEGTGPGYSSEQAAFRLWSGLAHQPPDLDNWVEANRAQSNNLTTDQTR
jgi:hypothetical protein